MVSTSNERLLTNLDANLDTDLDSSEDDYLENALAPKRGLTPAAMEQVGFVRTLVSGLGCGTLAVGVYVCVCVCVCVCVWRGAVGLSRKPAHLKKPLRGIRRRQSRVRPNLSQNAN